MSDANDSITVTNEYPPPPWHLAGQHWGTLFRTDKSVDAIEAESIGAKKLFSNRLGVALLHYTNGTLRYDELVVSVPIRIGLRPYIWIRDIWVSDPQSQAGGIHVWNLPKQLATFTWSDNSVTIRDQDGLVARLHLRHARTHWPWCFLFVPIAGSLNANWKTATARWRGRVSFTQLAVDEWSNRFTERLKPSRGIGFSSSRFSMTIPCGKLQG